jgi:hypothetical protein
VRIVEGGLFSRVKLQVTQAREPMAKLNEKILFDA